MFDFCFLPYLLGIFDFGELNFLLANDGEVLLLALVNAEVTGRSIGEGDVTVGDDHLGTVIYDDGIELQLLAFNGALLSSKIL